MEKFSRETLRPLKNDILEELVELAKERGIDFSFEGGRFETGEATLKLKIKIQGVESQSDKTFEFIRNENNFKTSDGNGRVLTGYDPRKPKYPWLYTQNGKNWKCTEQQAKEYFGQGEIVLTGNGD